ncbi:hypothetical protein RWE15_21165 [Virgibacillus halophilus]|uniref:Uncharacterized protein n=1 Tax=Tigheibacillus halophilus TaxID=361280 RepID=A0ABU5CAL4_9BACI|nr:hypothetical protein [Virgibacillus halophilus]
MEEQANKSKVFSETEYLLVYQYLLDQDVEESMAGKIVRQVKQKHQKNGLQPALSQIKKGCNTRNTITICSPCGNWHKRSAAS